MLDVLQNIIDKLTKIVKALITLDCPKLGVKYKELSVPCWTTSFPSRSLLLQFVQNQSDGQDWLFHLPSSSVDVLYAVLCIHFQVIDRTVTILVLSQACHNLAF